MPYSHPQILDKAIVYRDAKHTLPGMMALSITAGYVNSVLLGFLYTPVSHMSGAVSRLGLNLARGHVQGSFGSLLVVLGLVMGAMPAGVFVGATHLLPSRRFGVVPMAEGVLLFLATLLLLRRIPGSPMPVAACSLQNAMSSSYCGLMIRTTHVSGVVTDLFLLGLLLFCPLLLIATCFAEGTILFAVLQRQKGIEGDTDDNDETLPRTSIFPND